MFSKSINVKYQFLFITFLIFLFCEITTAQDETEIIETLDADSDSTVDRSLSFNGYPYAYYTPETELAWCRRDFHFLYIRSHRYVTFQSNPQWMVFY